jgi:hypothetical protein
MRHSVRSASIELTDAARREQQRAHQLADGDRGDLLAMRLPNDDALSYGKPI